MIYRNPTDFSVWPEVMREWMESVGSLEDIQEIDLSRDCYTNISDGGWKSYIPTSYLRLKVTITPLGHCCTFVQYKNEWMKADESGNISYTSSFEFEVKKEEMTDDDAFDLMDSIRKEMK